VLPSKINDKVMSVKWIDRPRPSKRQPGGETQRHRDR